MFNANDRVTYYGYPTRVRYFTIIDGVRHYAIDGFAMLVKDGLKAVTR